MQTVYIGNTLVNDVMLGAQRMDDVFTALPTIQAEYLVIASGNKGGTGGGFPNRRGGGGGAGGLLSGSLTILPNITYYVQVGGFDANNVAYDSYLTGSNFYNYTTGGGEGGTGNGTNTSRNGKNGGSGGGAAANVNGSGTAGTGVSGQGFGGGVAGGSNNAIGGGGGGANGAGASGAAGGAGGAGKSSAISGTLTTYSVGGNGGNTNAGVNHGDGGGSSPTVSPGGAPVNGVVIIRYLGAQRFNGGTVTTDGNFTIHTFNNTTSTTGAAFDRFTFIYQ
jgi:hypothetical protein